MPNDATIPYEEDVDHMIIWLDITIGDPNNYIHLKKAFSSTMDPKNETPVRLIDKDYDELLRNVGPTYVQFEGVWFLLAAFTNAEQCFQCFEQNQDKHIFFITSGSLGEVAVPIILNRFRQVFTDPETNESYSSIYVFCHSIENQMDWALEYSDYIQIFTHDADLLVRMIRDMADYFVFIGKRLLDEDPPNNAAAKHRLSWAHELYQRYRKMENVALQREFTEVNQLLDGIDDELTSSDEDN